MKKHDTNREQEGAEGNGGRAEDTMPPSETLSAEQRAEVIQQHGSIEEYDRVRSLIDMATSTLRAESRRMTPDPAILPDLHEALGRRRRERRTSPFAWLRVSVPLYQSLGGALALAALLFMASRLAPVGSLPAETIVVERTDTVRIHDTVYTPSESVERPFVAVSSLTAEPGSRTPRRAPARSTRRGARIAQGASRGDSNSGHSKGAMETRRFERRPQEAVGQATLSHIGSGHRGVSLAEDSAFRRFATKIP